MGASVRARGTDERVKSASELVEARQERWRENVAAAAMGAPGVNQAAVLKEVAEKALRTNQRPGRATAAAGTPNVVRPHAEGLHQTATPPQV